MRADQSGWAEVAGNAARSADSPLTALPFRALQCAALALLPVFALLFASSLLALAQDTPSALAQQPSQPNSTLEGAPAALPDAPSAAHDSTEYSIDTPQPSSFARWLGLPVRVIGFEGVSSERLVPLPGHLPQAEGAPLSEDKIRSSLRQLFATGLYESIQADAASLDDGVAITFRGAPRTFIGTVTVDGAKGGTMNSQLQRASQLNPGTRYTGDKLTRALAEMNRTLADNGFREPSITYILTPHLEEQLVDVSFHVVSGPQARVGAIEVAGDSGMTPEEFRHKSHLRPGATIDHDTPNRALDGVLRHYQKQDRLEADVKLESATYLTGLNRENFRFSATQGPIVRVIVEGAKINPERLRRVIPIFQEGAVDEDLLNEGNRRMRNYFQRLGYFDVKVDHAPQATASEQVTILYRVQLGPRRRIQSVSIVGNNYFDSATLKDLLSVHAATTLDPQGAYSQSLVSGDIAALQNVYRNNGFSNVKIVPETSTPETVAADISSPDSPSTAPTTSTPRTRSAPLAVVYRITEGSQQRVGTVAIEGTQLNDTLRLFTLLNTTPGQLLSPGNLAGDRDDLLTDLFQHGFNHPLVDITQKTESADLNKIDVIFHVTEGEQVFVGNVLLTGLHYTRPETVAKAITVHPGDPLNQSALIDTQRNLYDFALFNEVDTAVENPDGGNAYKTILLQAVEARRWAFTYGFGFEVQTGQPQYNCAGINLLSGGQCNPQGKTGVSPRVLADITRNSLFGREQSASVQGTYGLLEQKIDLLYQVPHFVGNRDLALAWSGGYANSLDVTTYVASKLETGARLTERFSAPNSKISKANTFIYEFDFRRVKVQATTLQVYPLEIEQLATAVRVAGPAFTWIRDSRDSPLDAHRGTYTSFQEFLSARPFGAQAQFNRLDLSNSSYYSFDHGRYILARNTRYGQERAFGNASSELIPLPERLYAGGATSLRGFSINAAGPRDPETGYPIGGAGALINSTELRLPPPTLPWVSDSVSLVLFHDMGNVFARASDAWPSFLRVRQPERENCETPIPATKPPTTPPGNDTSTGIQGSCSFNFFSHAIGLGLRYHTPAGPIRLDFSYNLNPPIYPVTYNYSNQLQPPHVSQVGHFNFFFSLGQTF
jgi:outer membrane protein assembly complex protein YaeT